MLLKDHSAECNVDNRLWGQAWGQEIETGDSQKATAITQAEGSNLDQDDGRENGKKCSYPRYILKIN